MVGGLGSGPPAPPINLALVFFEMLLIVYQMEKRNSNVAINMTIKNYYNTAK